MLQLALHSCKDIQRFEGEKKEFLFCSNMRVLTGNLADICSGGLHAGKLENSCCKPCQDFPLP